MNKPIGIKIFVVLTTLLFLSCDNDNTLLERKSGSGISYKSTEEEEKFLDSLQYYSFLYFVNEINPENGLVKDRSTETSPSSIAAVGWAYPVWAIGAEHGWITREYAAGLTLNSFRFFINSDQSGDTLSTGYKGFYYHFLDMETGKRWRKCELSTIDTEWLIAGVRFARQYYDRDNPVEQEIRELADSMTFRIDWDWATLPDDAGENHGSISMGWRPEKGFSKAGWIGYNEALLLYITAAGSGYKQYESAYNRWLSRYLWIEPYPGLAHVEFPPLFGHQYSEMFVDFRGLYDSYMKEKGIDYFENSRRAALVQRQYAIDNPNGWEGYDSLTWGLTACDGPQHDMELDPDKYWGYSARGTNGTEAGTRDDGTIAPTALGGAIVFAPGVIIPSLKAMYDKYGDKGLWGKYGMVDAFNLTVDWYDKDYLGLDQGPIVIMIENLRTGLVWEYSMKDSVNIKGLQKLGFIE